MLQGTLDFDAKPPVESPASVPCARLPNRAFDFDGQTYDRSEDQTRLNGQLREVYLLMSDGEWWTIRQLIERIGKGTETGISARIRDLRKQRFGGMSVESQRVGSGLWQYRLAKHDGLEKG